MSGQLQLYPNDALYLETLDAVMSYGPAVAIVWDLIPSRPVKFVSPNIEQFGYDPAQFLSGETTWADVMLPQDVVNSFDAVTEAIAEGQLRTELRYRIHTAGGDIRWVIDYTTYLRDRSGSARQAQGVLIDITDQVRREYVLEDFRAHASGLVYRYTLYPDGREQSDILNPERLAFFGMKPHSSKSTATSDNLWQTMLPDDVRGFRSSLARSAETLSLWDHEWRITDAAGEIRWLRGVGEPEPHTDGRTSWSLLVVDITEEKHRNEELASALQQTIGVLADAVELRDAYTAGHQKNVAELAFAIGRQMGLDSDRLIGLRLAALVHDVGKIRIPIEVLSKPDRLTGIEFDLIKQHAAFGGELLENIDARWPIADIVRQHHERLDGRGYPQGLSGDEILLEARVIAVADVLEAISSARPYRPSRGLSAARKEIENGRGIRYDAAVVDAAIALLDSDGIALHDGKLRALSVSNDRVRS